jgi:hypothetical protein
MPLSSVQKMMEKIISITEKKVIEVSIHNNGRN